MRPVQPPPREAEPASFRSAHRAEATDALPAHRAVAKDAARMQEAANKAAPTTRAAIGPTPAAASEGDGDGDGAAAATVGRMAHIRAVRAHLAATHGAPRRPRTAQKAGARRVAPAAPKKKERQRPAPAQKPCGRQTERAKAACDKRGTCAVADEGIAAIRPTAHKGVVCLWMRVRVPTGDTTANTRAHSGQAIAPRARAHCS